MSVTLTILPAISKLLDKIIPDPLARQQAKLELTRAERQLDLEELRLSLAADQSQTAINQTEAASRDRFVAGWRPFIGWVCGVAFAYHFVVQPILIFILVNQGQEVILPEFNMEALFTVLMGMLGLGGLRTLEKIKFVSK